MGAKNRIVAKTTHQAGRLGMTKPATRTTKKKAVEEIDEICKFNVVWS